MTGKTIMSVGLVVLACLFPIVGFTAKGEAEKVKVAIPGFGTLIPLTIAQEKGYYRDEGLEVEAILMGATIGIQALLAGEVQFAGAAGPALSAAVRGAPIRIIFTSVSRPMHWLMVKPEIRHVRDLKGKKIAVTSVGSTADFFVRNVLERHGIVGQEVAILALGINPNRYAGLVSGAVDGAMLATPFNFMAEDAGFRELVAYIKEDNYAELQGSLVTTDQVLKSKPALAQKFVRATLKGLIHAREKRSDAIRRLRVDLTTDESLATRAYDVIRPAFTLDGSVSEKDARTYYEMFLRMQGQERASPKFLKQTIDYSLVQKLGAELQAQGWTPGS